MKRLVLATIALACVAAPATPQYHIYDIGLVNQSDSASQAFRISDNGIATGRSVGSGVAQAYTWSLGGGISGLPNLSGRVYAVGNGVNNAGVVVGNGTTTLSGAGPLPVMWSGGVATQLALPGSSTLARANDVNNLNVAVGSAGSGINERASLYSGGSASILTATENNGCFFVTAFGINDSGMAAGIGWDPNNAARNVGFVYNTVTNTATEVGGLGGANGAICFDISEAGHAVGSSMLNQGSGLPFIWTPGGGMVAIPLAVGTSQGSARGVNSTGWAVGTDSSAFAIPFLYDGATTYRVADLLVNPTGWDLLTNTSSSAMSISEGGTIVGTAVLNGAIHAYAAVPVPEPASFVALLILLVAVLLRRVRPS